MRTFSSSSESHLGADGKVHTHSQQDGGTTSCKGGICHKITCHDGKCTTKVLDEASGRQLTADQVKTLKAKKKAGHSGEQKAPAPEFAPKN